MEEKIYEFLITHCMGKSNLIKNADLRKMFGIKSDKGLRQIIQNIREDKNFAGVVGAVSGKSGGYYMCITDGEVLETINNIKHRANQMLRMTHIIEYKLKKNYDNN